MRVTTNRPVGLLVVRHDDSAVACLLRLKETFKRYAKNATKSKKH